MANNHVRLAIATDPEAGSNDGKLAVGSRRTDAYMTRPEQRSSLRVNVRRVRLTDVAALSGIADTVMLNQPDTLLGGYQPMRAGLGAALPGRRDRRPFFVGMAEDRLVGFVQFAPCEPDGRWLLLAAGEATGVFPVEPVFTTLLEYGVRQAGLRGVKRLFARVPFGAIVEPSLIRQAWAPYASETVYIGRKNHPRINSRVVLRRQTRADTWAIHQLYNATVPKPVQDAEALTSHHWDLRLASSSNARHESTGWLLEDGHNVIGYARVTASGRASLLEFVYDPARLNTLSDLVDGALQIARRQPGSREYCAVRGYQAELATALEGRGLVPMSEQSLLIKYTTATARLPAIESVPFQLDVTDKMPQRVPTFLQGHPGDRPTT